MEQDIDEFNLPEHTNRGILKRKAKGPLHTKAVQHACKGYIQIKNHRGSDAKQYFTSVVANHINSMTRCAALTPCISLNVH